MNSKKELCIHLRAVNKDFCPAYWDLCAGGCIQPGFTDYDNARRELEEEYGVTGVHLDFVTTMKFSDEKNKCWGSIFFVNYDGDIKIQEEEIQEHKWVSLEDIQKDYIDNSDIKVTPDSVQVLKLLKDHYPNLLK